MRLRKALCLLLSMVLILSISMPETFATAIADDGMIADDDLIVDDSLIVDAYENPAPTACEECGQTEGHAADCSQYVSPITDGEAVHKTGDNILIKSGSEVYKTMSMENGWTLMEDYEVEIISITIDEDGNVWYEFSFNSLDDGEIILRDYKYVLADSIEEEQADDSDTDSSDTDSQDTDSHDCDCGEDASENLASHADSCPRKQYVLSLIRNENGGYRTAAEIYAQWETYDENTRRDILNIVESYIPTEYDTLVELVGSEDEDEDDPGITVDGVTVSGIPADVTLMIQNIVPRDMSQEAFEKIGSHKLVFSIDITLQNSQGDSWQPAQGENVTVTLDADQFSLKDGDAIAILHEHGGSLVELGTFTVENGKLTFTTDGFSNFYGYTVDFEYDGTWYSIGGGSDVYLYELFAMLKIDRSDSEVTGVSVSDPDLLSVSKVISDGYTGEKAWMIHSRKAFDTAETMEISFADESSITLNVYDADYTSLSGGDYTFNEGDTIGAVSIPNDSTVNIRLNGTVTVNGTISVGQGVTLTITGSGTLKRGNSFTDKMFYVAGGGNLIIKGDSENSIVIDGSASFTTSDVLDSTRKLLTTSGVTATSAAIYVGYEGNNVLPGTVGNVQLENVTMQNMYSSSQAPAIHVTGNQSDTIHSTVTLNNVTVRNCATISSNAIVLFNDCVANLSACQILDNYSGGIYAGAVKAGGSTWFSQLTMTNCIARGNYSSGWGGVVLWAANKACGEKTSKATIDGCTLTGNTARWLGGAVSNEAIMEVKNTTIQNNIAMAGGGIATFPFTLTTDKDGGGNACGLTLGKGNVISSNTAYASETFKPYSKKDNDSADGDDVTPLSNPTTYTGGGGGIWCYMNKNAWTCSLEIGDGNTISGNRANNVGGGVYVDKVAGSTTKLSITGATISGNKAINGGGVAVKAADVIISSGMIHSNTADKNGGGIYVESGSATVTGTGYVDSNTAKNGGGLYINDGAINVTGGIISLNKAVGSYSGSTTKDVVATLEGVGGGVFLKKGTFSLRGNYVGIHSNTADVAADDVYARGGDTTVDVPDVVDMTMTGLEIKPTGWYADYKEGDSNYPKTIIGEDNPGRYVANTPGNIKVEHGTLTNNKTTFYCLTLGIEHEGYGTLTIKKSGIDTRDHDGITEVQSSLFHIEGTTTQQGTEISLDVTVVGNDSVTIQHLPDGRYTVTEITDWTWRYDKMSKTYYPTADSSNVREIIQISALYPDWCADFENQRKQQYWLSGDCYCKNWWDEKSDANEIENEDK